jgi:hypothetical protein
MNTSEATRVDEPIRFILKPDRRRTSLGIRPGHPERRAIHRQLLGPDEVARRASGRDGIGRPGDAEVPAPPRPA